MSGGLQRVVLLDLGLERRLHYDRGFCHPGNLLLQPYAKTSRMRLSAKEEQVKQGQRLMGLTLGFLFQALDLNP